MFTGRKALGDFAREPWLFGLSKSISVFPPAFPRLKPPPLRRSSTRFPGDRRGWAALWRVLSDFRTVPLRSHSCDTGRRNAESDRGELAG